MTSELGVEELYIPVDCCPFVLGADPNQSTPYLAAFKGIPDNLAVTLGQVALPLHVVLAAAIHNAHVVHVLFGHDGEYLGVSPIPEHDLLIEFLVGEFFSGSDVEDLDDRLGFVLGVFRLELSPDVFFDFFRDLRNGMIPFESVFGRSLSKKHSKTIGFR